MNNNLFKEEFDTIVSIMSFKEEVSVFKGLVSYFFK